MTTIMNPDDNALFYVAIINPTGAVAHDRFARFGLADLAHALNSDKPNEPQQRFFATEEERDAFIAEHNARKTTPTCASCGNELSEDGVIGDGTNRGTCCACFYCYAESCECVYFRGEEE